MLTQTKSGLILPPSGRQEFKPVFDLTSAFDQIVAETIGMARGTNTEGDVLTQTVDGRDLNVMWRDFQEALGLWNQTRQNIVNLLSFSVNDPIEDVAVPSGDDFEEASEFGEPKGIRGGAFFSLAYDFKWYDLAVRYTWKYLAEATAAQVDSLNQMALEADNRLVFSKVLKAIFNNTTRTADIRNQPFNVYPFYNGDTTVPPVYKNIVHASGHNHYLSSASALAHTNVVGPGSSMEEHLRHHGYTKQNGYQMILMVNPAESAVIKTWRFNAPAGSPYDFVPAANQPPGLTPVIQGGVLVANNQQGVPPTTFGGLDVVGQYGPWLIVEEDYVPAGYLFGFVTGGPDRISNPVGVREHQNSALRGLRLVKGRDNDYPLIDSFYNRGFGTGIRHRGAGVLLKVNDVGAVYDPPAEYL